MSRNLVAILALGGCLFATAARAHDQPYSFLDLRLEGAELRGSFVAHVFDLAHEIGLAAPDSLLEPGVAARDAERLSALLAPRVRVSADGEPVTLLWTEAAPDRERNGIAFRVHATLPRPPAAIEIAVDPFPYDPEHETYVNLRENGALRHQELFAGDRRSATFYAGSPRGTLAVIATFVRSGIHHIFIGPDHILFVLGLLLRGGSVLRLLEIITAFTLAHSVTLALAALGLVQPPARLIEPAIALSIVYVGWDTLRAREGAADRRPWLALGFGLVHGFGFASVLREFGLPQLALGWSLFSFNLGVEIGQACIVGIAAPALVLLLRRAPAWHRRVKFLGSCLVLLAGAWWFVERTLLSGR